ncbi:glucosamine-6-phosphate deaminase [Ancylobacter pratisalsi]|uniref:Glucosamine-6-phosphate deaminase n=1 Tax=Ancylobacter pratisalsi TaxID=1745854 RepID=A0A6P1YHM0_9HYPH|nr:glucosamine-6-phosphate deaminase [Ancylobacter pratisalsi]QIB32291.1 glucosamine-6-phosphate deaminase [Ancylobacter pratisalsi]
MIDIKIHDTKPENGAAAAAFGAAAIRDAIAARGKANVVVATGASQFEMLEALVAAADIDWSKVTAFHLDEYIGMPETHPASFRKYLKERFTGKLPTLGAFHFVVGDAPDLDAELDRMNAVLDAHPIDVMFAGIGENGHLAFNDPPADFETTLAYKVVELEERCRRQQFGEGWFPTFDDVPTRAISMTVQRIVSSRVIILTVPDERKAEATQHVLEGPVTNMWPASILQEHPNCHAFLDSAAASRLAK